MKSSIYTLTGILLFTVLVPGAPEVQAEQAVCQKPFSYAEFRAAGLHLSQALYGIDRDFEFQLAQAYRSQVLPNPNVSVEKTYTGMELQGANHSQTEVTLSQPFRLSHFGSRARLSRLIKEAGNVTRQRELLRLSLQYAYQYNQLVALQEIEAVLSHVESRTSERVSQVREGVSKGLFSAGDEMLFEGEKYRLRAQREGIKAEIAILQQQIQSDTGMECLVHASSTYEGLPLPGIEEVLARASKSSLSELSRLDLLMDMTQKRYEVAKLDIIPELAPRAIYQRTNDGGDFFGAGMSFDLPFWNQNTPERMEASAQKRLLQKKKEILAGDGFERQIRNLYSATLSAMKKADLYRTKVVPAFESALNSEEKKYEKGAGSVLQVWQMLRTYSDARIQSQRYQLESLELRIELSLLVGEEI